MRKALPLLMLILAAALAAHAQQGDPQATGNVWLDIGGGRAGALVYPQYKYSLPIEGGVIAGYGFCETAPYEEVFCNNLILVTGTDLPWLTTQMETGGLPAHAKGFFQVGPRVNLQELVPKLKRFTPNLFVAYMPKLAGIRTNNFLIAGATNQLPIIGTLLTSHVEAFNRTFSTFSYGEAWLVFHVNTWDRVEPLLHVIRDSSRDPTYTVAIGLRLRIH